MDNFQQLVAHNLGITLSNAQTDMFALFEEILLKWNKKYNLTAITNPDEIRIKHFYDSLTCFSMIPVNETIMLIDIGTGAGFPGIPLIIINPLIQLTLVESIAKKADFCQIALNELGFKDTHVVTSRAETIGQEPIHREHYDWAVARAVAPLSVLVEYSLPLVRVGGSVLAQKGIELDTEINEAKKAISLLGGNVVSTLPISLPNNMGKRTLIQIGKKKPTPAIYPRRPGTPKKSPLI
ncbi:MAG: 16S rRNA (guanine(527)-N(7))-methyltransferase RsmG [Pelolinea sp.]|nr:16S rRNA (guanine(527)-N(7))-methyltransferase RsmG [Pelolinea sp.]